MPASKTGFTPDWKKLVAGGHSRRAHRSFELWRRGCVREACPHVLLASRMTVDRETPMLLPPDLRDWILVTLSYNVRRLHTLGAVLKAA